MARKHGSTDAFDDASNGTCAVWQVGAGDIVTKQQAEQNWGASLPSIE